MMSDKYKNIKMPTAPTPSETDSLESEFDGEMVEPSPLADFSDEEILAEARARGLSLEAEAPMEAGEAVPMEADASPMPSKMRG